MATENTEATPTQESPAMGDHGEGEPAVQKSVEDLPNSDNAPEKQASKHSVGAEPTGTQFAAAEPPAEETTTTHEDKAHVNKVHEDKAHENRLSKRDSERKKTQSGERRHSSMQEPFGSASMNAAIDKARSSSTRHSSRMSDFKTTRAASRVTSLLFFAIVCTIIIFNLFGNRVATYEYLID